MTSGQDMDVVLSGPTLLKLPASQLHKIPIHSLSFSTFAQSRTDSFYTLSPFPLTYALPTVMHPAEFWDHYITASVCELTQSLRGGRR